ACTGNPVHEPVNSPPLGWLESAQDASGATHVKIGDSVIVRGWASDVDDGAPVKRVAVLVDSVSFGDAQLGLPRPDIAAARGDQRFANSGWTFALDTSRLAAGSHTVEAVAYDSKGVSQS